VSSTIEQHFEATRNRYDAGLAAAGVPAGATITKGWSEGQPQGFVDVRGDWLFGPKHISHERANLKRPKVVLVCPDDAFETISGGGKSVRPSPVGEKSVVYTRRANLFWHVWAEDRGVVEEVVANIVVCQLRALPAGSGSARTFKPVGTRWPHDEEPDAKSAGSYAILQCELVHRVTDQLTVRRTVEVSEIDHTGSFAGEAIC
jgi:hypothetical protein